MSYPHSSLLTHSVSRLRARDGASCVCACGCGSPSPSLSIHRPVHFFRYVDHEPSISPSACPYAASVGIYIFADNCISGMDEAIRCLACFPCSRIDSFCFSKNRYVVHMSHLSAIVSIFTGGENINILDQSALSRSRIVTIRTCRNSTQSSFRKPWKRTFNTRTVLLSPSMSIVAHYEFSLIVFTATVS